MKKLFDPLPLGGISLPNRVLYAPLAGCSDYPFRQMSRMYGPGIVYCEMVKMDAVIRRAPSTMELLHFDPSMHPIGAQMCGSKVEIAKDAARILEDMGFDVIDFNCGCPVDKVTKDGSGSGMLKNPEKIGDILSEIVQSVRIPVTVKIRAGWDDKSICAALVTEIAEKAGAKAIAVHGRTREQGYQGAAKWSYIQEAKQAAKEILVIGNGDLFDEEAPFRMLQETGCDAVLISRGTLGQPWIAEDILCKAKGDTLPIRTALDTKEALLLHFAKILAYRDERQALFDFRRVGCWYLKKFSGAKELRMRLNQSQTTREALSLVENFSWEALA